MKTEKQIEEMAKDMINERWSHIVIPQNLNTFTYKELILMMVKICTQAQKDLLAEASEVFEEWWNNQDSVSYPSSLERCWQASRLPLMKKIEELETKIKVNQVYSGITSGKNFSVEHVKLQKENEELREALDWATKTNSLNSPAMWIVDCHEWKEANKAQEIRTKFSLDKNDKESSHE